MISDTCIEISFPATETINNTKRTIWIVMDKDGDWFISYTDQYATKQEIISK